MKQTGPSELERSVFGGLLNSYMKNPAGTQEMDSSIFPDCWGGDGVVVEF